MHKKRNIILGIIVILVGFTIFLIKNNTEKTTYLNEKEDITEIESDINNQSDAIEMDQPNETAETVNIDSEYTLQMVSEHNSANDCWQVINGTIYDMTDFIANGFHKGGIDVIIAECGTDSSAIFAQSHSGRKATQANNGLEDLVVIGKLAQ